MLVKGATVTYENVMAYNLHQSGIIASMKFWYDIWECGFVCLEDFEEGKWKSVWYPKKVWKQILIQTQRSWIIE